MAKVEGWWVEPSGTERRVGCPDHPGHEHVWRHINDRTNSVKVR